MARFPYGRDHLHRFEGNPVLTLEDIPFKASAVFNGSPVKKEDGYYLLLRVEGQRGYSFFALAHSHNGFHFTVEKEPVMLPATEGPFARYEKRGIEDPRITQIDDRFLVVYTASSEYGPRLALAQTKDLYNYERIGLISGPGNKDGVLFPEKINGNYVRLDRPIGKNIGCIWTSQSPNLLDWGNSEPNVCPRAGFWDSYRVGASAPPIRTDKGWLEIYHGVKMTNSGPIYRMGTVLYDLKDPTTVVARCKEPCLSPREDYERIGDVFNVVFACGAILENNGEIKVYYGGADTCICVATTQFDDLMEFTLAGAENKV